MGYVGFSMSENAVAAYNNGEMPMSKWSKKAILEAVEKNEDDRTLSFDFGLFSKLTLSQLRKFLTFSSWHHTSKEFNHTDFFAVDFDALEELTDDKIKALLAEKPQKQPKPVKPTPTMRKCKYLTWSGSRNHRKATEHEAECEVIGNWAYTPHGKKSITAKGFAFLDKRENEMPMEKTATEKPRTLDRDQIRQLVSYLNRNFYLKCDGTLRHTKEWIISIGEEDNMDAIIEQLQKMGGYCDCEVTMNCPFC